MADVIRRKGLGDIRTGSSARVRSTPRREGTAHRDLYLLVTEKQRLEQALTQLETRRMQLTGHLRETLQAMAELDPRLRDEEATGWLSESPLGGAAMAGQGGRPSGDGRWKMMPVGY